MKVHIKAFCLLLSGLLILNFMSFGVTVYAAASSSVGTPIPFGSLPVEQKDPYLQALKQFLHDFFGLYGEDKYIYVDPDTGDQIIGTEQEIYSYIQGKLETDGDDLEVNGIQDEYGNILFYTLVSSTPIGEGVYDLISYLIVDEVCSLTYESYATNLYKQTAGGRIPINSNSYSKALNDVIKKISSDSFSIGLDIINGVPQNVTTIKQDAYISVFDTLGLKYTLAPSILDFQFSRVFDTKDFPFLRCTPFFITSDNKLYVLNADITFSSNAFMFHSFDLYNTTGSGNKSLSYFPARVSFRFVDNSGHLYFCFHSSEYRSSYNILYYNQYTFGSPSVSNAPFLFYDYRDGLSIPASAELSTVFKNYNISGGGVYFRCPVDLSNPLIDSDILSADIVTFGCLQSNSDNIRFNSSILESAAQMLLSSENVVSGGDKTITSELTDWQKAIYVLAQQQGISFEEMLKKLDLIIDSNGEITLLGLDGIEYSVSELVKSFDEIIGVVGDISGDLSKLLEYLKSLNIEGLDKYIQSIEGTLNDLNERDKDKSAVLGDCLGTLTDLKEIFKDLDVSQISSQVKSIDETLERIDERQQAEDKYYEDMKAFLFDYQVSSYKLYDQCKYFIDNLFNYSDRNKPPTFQFYYDSNGDGENETYTLLDLSFLDTVLTNENMVDKSFWVTPIKVIDLIRYVIAIVCYGLFVMRLIKRLPSFYGNGPLSFLG